MVRTLWLAVASIAGSQAATAAPTPRITCQVATAHGAAREYTLQQATTGGERQWVLAMTGGDAGDRPVRLRLPKARPEIGSDRATLAYRNANGGRQIDLRIEPSGSTVDVWVDHGLEVNIEPDLDPRVDLMNTEGRVPATCAIAILP